VLLLSLAFMATGGFLGLHAIGTPRVLFTEEFAGFQVAIPVGLLVSAVFAAASAFVDVRPGTGQWLMRRRTLLRGAVLIAMALWFGWTVLTLPPLNRPGSEAARGSLLATIAIVGAVVYTINATRYWLLFRRRPTLLSAAERRVTSGAAMPQYALSIAATSAAGERSAESWRSSSATASSRRSTVVATNPTTPFVRRVPPLRCSGSCKASQRSIPIGRACGSASTAAKR
jgi:hypothetical protein